MLYRNIASTPYQEDSCKIASDNAMYPDHIYNDGYKHILVICRLILLHAFPQHIAIGSHLRFITTYTLCGDILHHLLKHYPSSISRYLASAYTVYPDLVSEDGFRYITFDA